MGFLVFDGIFFGNAGNCSRKFDRNNWPKTCKWQLKDVWTPPSLPSLCPIHLCPAASGLPGACMLCSLLEFGIGLFHHTSEPACPMPAKYPPSRMPPFLVISLFTTRGSPWQHQTLGSAAQVFIHWEIKPKTPLLFLKNNGVRGNPQKGHNADYGQQKKQQGMLLWHGQGQIGGNTDKLLTCVGVGSGGECGAQWNNGGDGMVAHSLAIRHPPKTLSIHPQPPAFHMCTERLPLRLVAFICFPSSFTYSGNVCKIVSRRFGTWRHAM